MIDLVKKEACSKLEKSRWHQWRRVSIREVVQLNDVPGHIESSIYRGIQNIKNLNVILKKADKNLRLVPIRGGIYNAMVWKLPQKPSFSMVISISQKRFCIRL